MKKRIFDTLACQQCLGKLSFVSDRLICNSCKIAYAISNNIVYMGYDKNKEEEVKKIIITERDHHTNLADMQKHYNYAYPSYKIGLLSISTLRDDTKTANPIAVDIGSGNAPMCSMLSNNGFDAYRCELDPNTLYSSFIWEHPNLDIGKNIVCDVTLLPFLDNSVDVVFCKELIHHVNDYNLLFSEINRVLKKDGIFLLIEPTLDIYGLLHLKHLKEHYGHHYKSIFNYYIALKRNRFIVYRYYIYYYSKYGKLKFFNLFRTYCHQQIFSRSKTSKANLLLMMLIKSLIGGCNVVYAKKNKNALIPKYRPAIKVVEPNQLILDKGYLNDIRLKKFNKILDDVYRSVIKAGI